MSEAATTPESLLRHSRPWLAAALSIVQPGLGHFYAGHWPYGVVFLFLSSLYGLPLIALVVTGQVRQPLLLVFSVIAAGVIVTATVLAYRFSRRAQPSSRRWWQHPAMLTTIPVLSVSLVQIPLPIAIDTFRNYSVASNAMWPALSAGEVFLTTSWPYRWRSPEAGEIVIFHLPEDRQVDFVMRVIAIGGDQVEIRQGQISVNGQPLKLKPTRTVDRPPGERELAHLSREFVERRSYEIAPSGLRDPKFSMAQSTVPVGHVFVLGDNRGNSRDSRYFGPVRVADVTSKAIRIIASPQKGRFWAPLDGSWPAD